MHMELLQSLGRKIKNEWMAACFFGMQIRTTAIVRLGSRVRVRVIWELSSAQLQGPPISQGSSARQW